MNTKMMTNPNKSYDITDDNGCIFCEKHYIPEEILSLILSYVPSKDLVFCCRRVCKFWCNVVDWQVWRIKFSRQKLSVSKVRDLPWFACFWILQKNPFDRNLVKNSCGQENFKHWKVISSPHLWKVEKPPKGCEALPKDSDNEELNSSLSCFSTSYDSCSKEQIIDLKKEGAVSQIMDFLQPKITISEWYCGRADSRCIYEFKTAILDEHQNPIDEYEIEKILDQADGSSWQKVSHVFENYGEGVRYIWIYHCGKDLIFWRGQFGSKMTGTSVVLSLPSKQTEIKMQAISKYDT